VTGNLRRYRLVALCILIPVLVFAVTWGAKHLHISVK
jgi:hypothetical protein